MALLVVGVLVARQVLIGYLTPDFLVSQIEQRWNCRAQIDSVKVSLSGSTTVELVGVALAPRDDFANRNALLAERDPLPEADMMLRSERVFLEIMPGELVRRQLNIRQLQLDGLMVSATIQRDGGTSLKPLFQPPQKEKPVVASTVVESATVAEPASSPEVEAGLNLATVANKLEVREGTVNLRVESSGADIRLEEFSLALTEIDVNPRDLAAHNRATAQFSGNLIVLPPAPADAGDVAPAAEYLRARVSGLGRIQPFEVETGELDPVWSADLTVHQGSEIDTFPLVERLRALLDGVDTGGVTFDDLHLRGTLLADATTEIGHAGGKYLMKRPLELQLPDTTIEVDKGSWMHAGTNEHKMKGQLTASEALTRQIEGKVDAYLQQKAGSLASGNLRGLILSPLMRDGRLVIEISSRGDLAEPEVDLVTPMGNLSDIIGTGKSTIKSLEGLGKGLLKGLLGN